MIQMYPFISLFVIQLIIIVLEKINDKSVSKSMYSCLFAYSSPYFLFHFSFYIL